MADAGRYRLDGSRQYDKIPSDRQCPAHAVVFHGIGSTAGATFQPRGDTAGGGAKENLGRT